MTKKLESLFDLPENQKIVQEEQKQKPVPAAQEDTMRDIADLDKIAEALPQVKGLGELADNELNEVADKAMQAYEDLMDLGMNVESRYSGRVFEVAGTMLKTNLDAKVAKLDKKLKMVELQLKKEKSDRDAGQGPDGFTSGEGFVVTDRNSLLDKLKGMNSDK